MNLRLRNNALAGLLEQVAVGATYFLFYGILVRVFGASDVGVVSLVLVLSSVGQFANVGFGSALMRYLPMYEGRGDRARSLHAIESAMICATVCYSIALAIIYYPFELLITMQVGQGHAAAVHSMMVPATINVLVLGIGAVTSAALSALMRSDLRAISNVFGSAICLGVLIGGAPVFGPVAAFWALAAQSVAALIASWFFLRRTLPGLNLIPRRLSREMIGELVRFGYKLQAQALLLTAVEPVSRLLIAHYGSLAQVAYFSMSARLLWQVRLLIYSAAQPVLSAFAYLREHDPERRQALYAAFSSIIGLASILGLSATVAASPFIAELWLGSREEAFELYVAILAVGWLGMTANLGSYFNAYSIGHLRYNLFSHVVMAAFNVVAGPTLGMAFGPVGVVAAMSASLLLAGAVISIGNRRLEPAPPAAAFKADIIAFALGCAAAALAVAAYHWCRVEWSSVPSAAVAGALWMLVMTPALLNHPGRPAATRFLSFRAARNLEEGQSAGP